MISSLHHPIAESSGLDLDGPISIPLSPSTSLVPPSKGTRYICHILASPTKINNQSSIRSPPPLPLPTVPHRDWLPDRKSFHSHRWASRYGRGRSPEGMSLQPRQREWSSNRTQFPRAPEGRQLTSTALWSLDENEWRPSLPAYADRTCWATSSKESAPNETVPRWIWKKNRQYFEITMLPTNIEDSFQSCMPK